MSITIHENMRAAFRSALLEIDKLPVQHWEGKQFFPIKGTPYVSETFRPISSIPRATGIGGTIAHTMTGNFILHYPANEGTVDLERMAAKIMDKFFPGSTLSYGGEAGVVTQSERGPLLQEPDWVNCTLVVTLVAYTSR